MEIQNGNPSFGEITSAPNSVSTPIPPHREISQTTFAWLSYSLLLLSIVILSCAGVYNDFSIYDSHQIALSAGIVGLVLAVVYVFEISIKRLKDMGKSPWLSLLYLIPFITPFFWFYLVIAKTRYDNNDYKENNPFIFEGRMERAAFGLITIPLTVILLIVAICAKSISANTSDELILIFFVVAVLSEMIYPLLISCGLKRLRDIGRGKNFMWFSLIPLVNIGLWVYLLFAAGTKGSDSNKPFYKAMWDVLDS